MVRNVSIEPIWTAAKQPQKHKLNKRKCHWISEFRRATESVLFVLVKFRRVTKSILFRYYSMGLECTVTLANIFFWQLLFVSLIIWKGWTMP